MALENGAIQIMRTMNRKLKEFLHWYPITIIIPIMLILVLLGAFGVL